MGLELVLGNFGEGHKEGGSCSGLVAIKKWGVFL